MSITMCIIQRFVGRHKICIKQFDIPPEILASLKFLAAPLLAMMLLATAMISPWLTIWLTAIPPPFSEDQPHKGLQSIVAVLDDLALLLKEDRDIMASPSPPNTRGNMADRLEGAAVLVYIAEQKANWLSEEAPALERTFKLKRIGEDILRPVLLNHTRLLRRLENMLGPDRTNEAQLREEFDHIRTPLDTIIARIKAHQYRPYQ